MAKEINNLTKEKMKYYTSKILAKIPKISSGTTSPSVDALSDGEIYLELYSDDGSLPEVTTYSDNDEFGLTHDGEASVTTYKSLSDSIVKKTSGGVDVTDLYKRLVALETWKSQVLDGATTVLVETEATSTASTDDEEVSDTAINTNGLEEPTLGDVEVEETTEETEVESSESESTSTSDNTSTSTSESQSESESDSMSESELLSEYESESESTSESEVTSESIQIEPQTKEELS